MIHRHLAGLIALPLAPRRARFATATNSQPVITIKAKDQLSRAESPLQTACEC